jgi:hypothetical protein
VPTYQLIYPDRERAIRRDEQLRQEGHQSQVTHRGETWIVTFSYPGPIEWLYQKMHEKYPNEWGFVQNDWDSEQPVSLWSALRNLASVLFGRR